MTRQEKLEEIFEYIADGYGCWFVDAYDIHPANVTAVIDRLLASPAIKEAFHQDRKKLWIKFADDKNIPGNRAAIESAFSVNTF